MVLREALAATLAFAALAAAGADDPATRRRQTLEQETIRLSREMEALAARERGLLGEVTRLDARLAVERLRLEEASSGLAAAESRLARGESAAASLEADVRARAPLAAARVRAIYERGPAAVLTRVVMPADAAAGWDGLRYASYLARRDGRQIAAWRTSAARLDGERASLAAERQRLASQRDEAERQKAELEATLASREALLTRIRDDREQHARAIGELDAAAANLGSLVESLDEAPAAPLDVRKFRGLLDWPAEGRVSSGYGNVVHPRFKTQVPHPGLDIDAAEGSPFRAVFDGRVAFAAPLQGYGLAVVVDHGNGVASVYAHAGVLLVQAGDAVAKGQELGRVGDSGSLRGPYLYFEIRAAGKPEDPSEWLRKR